MTDKIEVEQAKDLKSQRRIQVANIVLQYVVALAVVGTVAYSCWTLTHVALKDNNNNAFLMILGSALSWMGVLLAFCFPNSIGAQKTQETMHNTLMQLLPKATLPLPAQPIDVTASLEKEEPKHAQSQGRTTGTPVPPEGHGVIDRPSTVDSGHMGEEPAVADPVPTTTSTGTPATTSVDFTDDVDYAPTEAPPAR